MLKSLSVENFGVTRSAHLDFGQGFCALTGETGAGKSMLVDALAAALGSRSDSAWVRQGCSKATVSAVFEASLSAQGWLLARGIDCDEGEVSLRRAVEAEGRSKAWINGVSVSGAELREIGGMLAAIHGQHESVALLAPKAQREHLDAYAKAGPALAEVAERHKAWSLARDRARGAAAQAESLAKERSQLAWELDEITRVAPQPGEWESLEEQHGRLSRSAEIDEACVSALGELTDDEGSICSRLSRMSRVLADFPAPRLRDAALALQQAAEAAADASREISRFKDGEDMSSERLEQIDARLRDIHALSRKLRQPPQDLAARAVEAKSKLDSIEAGLDARRMAAEEAGALAELTAACCALTAARKAAATRLAKAASANLSKLGMGKARMEIAIEPRPPGPEGADSVEFALAGHEGAKTLPLAKCASGGELARIGLALCAASLEQDQPGCMVFDEVDAGIGGPTAVKVGQMLAKIGSKGQALAVTHLPQVAALADRHYAVGKRAGESGPESVVKHVSGAEREREVARMLGDAKAESALEHAKALLASRG